MLRQLKSRISEYTPRAIESNESFPDAAVLVPLRESHDGLELMLTLRASHLNTHRGQVAFPGGKFDEEDGALIKTALRESWEEVALDPNDVEVLGQLSEVISLHGIRVTPFVALIGPELDLKPNPDELDSIFYVDIKKIIEAKPKRRDRMTYKGTALSVPSYDYEYEGQSYEIWGLSAIVMVELLNIAFDAGITIFEDSSSKGNGSWVK